MPQELQIQTAPISIEKPSRNTLPTPEPIKTQKVEWFVVTPKTIPQSDFVFIAMTPLSYETLSLNEAEVLRWVREAKWRLTYYEKGN